MNEFKFFRTGFFVLVFSVAILAINCGPPPPVEPEPEPVNICPSGEATRTEDCDEFKKIDPNVRKNGTVFTSSGWYPLKSGDDISTNESGQAELNFASCWNGRIFIFQDSNQFIVGSCGKTAYTAQPQPAICAQFGTIFVGNCASEFSIDTLNGKITAASTYVLTFLPERSGYRDILLLVVLEGEAYLDPIESIESTGFSERITVRGGEFMFMMPVEYENTIMDLDPRATYSLEMLPILDEVLNISDWMFDARELGIEDGVLPPNWPDEFGGPEITEPAQPIEIDRLTLEFGGGVLDDELVQEALITSINWEAVTGNAEIYVNIDNQPFEVYFDREMSNKLIKEGGYTPDQISFTFMYPAGDSRIEKIAYAMTKYLLQLGVNVGVTAVDRSEIMDKVKVFKAAGESYMVILR